VAIPVSSEKVLEFPVVFPDNASLHQKQQAAD
jgi:hypothetical protein